MLILLLSISLIINIMRLITLKTKKEIRVGQSMLFQLLTQKLKLYLLIHLNSRILLKENKKENRVQEDKEV